MRVLLVHNHYGSEAPSGENRVFELERDLLVRNGHTIETFERHSDTLIARGNLGLLSGAISTPWNFASAKQMRDVIQYFRPEVVHVHNTFPIISSSIFPAARGVARILTLHNFRLFCPAAIPIRAGEVCTLCLDRRSVLPSLRYSCYRRSRVATLPLAVSTVLHRFLRTWERDIEVFIVLTEFQRDLMISAGLPEDKIAIKPNFSPGKPQSVPWSQRKDRVVFVGRLSPEKGVEDLIDAWLTWGENAPELRIIGDGPLLNTLRQRAEGRRNVVFLGHVAAEVVVVELAQAKLLVLPSMFETFGLVLIEAFQTGTPVCVSNRGPLPRIAFDARGIVFRAGDPLDLLAKVKSVWGDQERLTLMSEASIRCFEARYSERVSYDALISIYERAIERASRGRR